MINTVAIVVGGDPYLMQVLREQLPAGLAVLPAEPGEDASATAGQSAPTPRAAEQAVDLLIVVDAPVEGLRAARRRYPDARLLAVLTHSTEPAEVVAAFDNGADACAASGYPQEIAAHAGALLRSPPQPREVRT